MLTSLPSKFSNPGSMVYATGSPITPQFYIPSTRNFGTIIGLSPGGTLTVLTAVSAFQPGGGVWLATSDSRIKTDINLCSKEELYDIASNIKRNTMVMIIIILDW